jgi:cell division protein FtsW (lipid II flippase)
VFCCFSVWDLLLGLAASPPLAARNGLDPFYYVHRQAFFGALAIAVLLIASMMAPATLRRLGVLGFIAAFVALALLPVVRNRFRKGCCALVQPRLRIGATVGIPETLLHRAEPRGYWQRGRR